MPSFTWKNWLMNSCYYEANNEEQKSIFSKHILAQGGPNLLLSYLEIQLRSIVFTLEQAQFGSFAYLFIFIFYKTNIYYKYLKNLNAPVRKQILRNLRFLFKPILNIKNNWDISSKNLCY